MFKSPELRDFEVRLGLAKAVSERVEKEVSQLQDQSVALEADSKAYAEILLFLRALADQLKAKVKDRFERVMTAAVQALLGKETSVCIVQSFKRGRVVNELKIRTTIAGEEVELDPMQAEAGAAVDLLSFVIRVCLLLMHGSRFLVCDEPMKMVSEKYIPNVGEFLRVLVDRLGMDILMVTHQRSLEDYADYCYELRDGVLQVVKRPQDCTFAT